MRNEVNKLFLTAVCICAGFAAQAQTVRYKANNEDNLNLGSSWVGGLPNANIIAVWTNTVTGANSVQLGADLSYLGIRIANPGGDVTIGGANTLRTDMMGFDLSGATADLTLNNASLTLLDFVSTAWNVASGRTLTVSPTVFTRGDRAALRLPGAGTVASSTIVNDATGIVGPWASIGTGTATRYVTVSGGNLVGYTGTEAATAADVTDTTGTVNYDVAAPGAIPAGVSLNTLRYTGAAGGTITGSFTANGILSAGAGSFVLNSGVITIGPTRELVLTTPDATRIYGISSPIADHASGASGVTLAGGGSCNLRGNNTYSGVTVVNSGILYPYHDNALGTTDGHTVIYSTGRLDGGRLILPGGVTLAEPITIAGPGDGSAGGWERAITCLANTTNTLTGTITLTGTAAYRIGHDAQNAVLNIGPIQRSTASGGQLALHISTNSIFNANGPIDLNGGILACQYGGTVVLNAASNDVGEVRVNRYNILKPGVPDALAASATLRIGNVPSNTTRTTGGEDVGTVDLAGVSPALDKLEGYPNGGTVPNNATASDSRKITSSSASAATFTVGIRNGSGTFDGVIENGAGGGSIALTKVGTGTLTLTGNRDNTYTGLTAVANGILELNKTNGYTAVAGNIVIGAGTSQLRHLQNEQIADTATVTMTAATSMWDLKGKSETVANVDMQNASPTVNLGLVSGSPGKLTVTDTLTHTLGHITLNSAGAALTTIITANRLVNRGGTWTFGTTSGTQSLQIGPGGLTIGGGSTIPVAATSTISNHISLAGNITSEATVAPNTAANTISGTGRVLLNGPREFIVADGAAPVDLSVSAIIADGTGTSSITKSGTGTLSLSGANTFTGGITVDEGTLAISSLTPLPGWDTPGLYTIASNATLAVGNGFADAGIAALFASANFADGANRGFDTTLGDRTYAADLADPSGIALRLAKVGANTLTLTGANTYSGGTVIQNGALSIPTTGALPGWNTAGSYEVWRDAGLAVYNAISDANIATMLGTGNFLDGACIGFDTTSGDRAYSTVIGDTANGALGVYKVGRNTLTLSGDNTYDGNTFVTRGGLYFNHNNALGTTNGYTAIYATGHNTNGGMVAIGPNVTTKENFVLTGPGDGNGGYSPALYSAGGGTRTVDGAITLASQGKTFRINPTGGKLILNGPVGLASGVTSCNLTSEPQPGTELFVSNTVDCGTGNYSVLGTYTQGVVNICSTGNNWALLWIYQGGTARLGVDDALPTDKRVRLGWTSGQIGTLDLAGFDQTVGALEVYGTAQSLRNNVISNSAPSSFSTLTVNQAAGVSNAVAGRIIGAVHLVKAGAADSQLLLQEVNELSGTATVTGGKLVLDGAAGSLGASCTNVVVDAGTLTVRNSSAIADRAVLRVAAGGDAKVELAEGVNEAVGYLYLDGEMRRAGTYGSTGSAAAHKDDGVFSGTGVLTVLYDTSGTVIMLR
ncbi:MAG TPA: autotransporter-associated beta strand repeat-containing protein [Kiritimatiellia bacterium]|nr:autotransporter-associated beta strand repeat-containing protein [Kiritimatiellia bacterium]HPS09227.1 autotransporter-associated beta strand repeat-containing protein [Kiritimatiellia bacterium]